MIIGKLPLSNYKKKGCIYSQKKALLLSDITEKTGKLHIAQESLCE
jgi:hypothetical protein